MTAENPLYTALMLFLEQYMPMAGVFKSYAAIKYIA
jgi:hypothetical protein